MKTLFLSLLLCCCVFTMSEAKTGDTVTTASGLKYVLLKKGDGRTLQKGEVAIVHYTGTLLNGKEFDSSRDRGTPFAFPLGQGRVIKGWDEAFSLLHIGDRAMLIIPSNLAYGERSVGTVIKPNSTLVFDVELLDAKEKTVGAVLAKILDEQGRVAAVQEFERMKANNFADAYMTEGELNMLGYSLIQRELLNDAITFLKLNVEMYPDSFNVYDSLAEAYMLNGDRKLAVENYRRSLEINPDNTNATEMLQKLEQK
jgi:tetratricopeptide (TPR) repeat protein